MPSRSEPTLLHAPETRVVLAALVAIVAGVVGSLAVVAARSDLLWHDLRGSVQVGDAGNVERFPDRPFRMTLELPAGAPAGTTVAARQTFAVSGQRACLFGLVTAQGATTAAAVQARVGAAGREIWRASLAAPQSAIVSVEDIPSREGMVELSFELVASAASVDAAAPPPRVRFQYFRLHSCP